MVLVLNRRKRRLDAVIGRVAAERMNQVKGASEAERKKAIQSKLMEVEAKRAGRKKFRLSDALAQAGLATRPPQFIMISIIVAIALGGLAWTMTPLLGLLGALAGGLWLPRVALKVMTKRRLKKFTGIFADAIDVIVRGVRSGLPVGECMKIIGRELPEPVGGEFRQVTEGVRLGMTLQDSLQRMGERVPTAEVHFFCIVLAINQQTGGNLAVTLKNLSDVLRARKRMRDKIQAMSSEAKASAGIIGSLPIAVGSLLAVIAPDYIGLLFTTSTGHWILAGGVGIMGVGIMVMRAMINFEM